MKSTTLKSMQSGALQRTAGFESAKTGTHVPRLVVWSPRRSRGKGSAQLSEVSRSSDSLTVDMARTPQRKQNRVPSYPSVVCVELDFNLLRYPRKLLYIAMLWGTLAYFNNKSNAFTPDRQRQLQKGNSRWQLTIVCTKWSKAFKFIITNYSYQNVRHWYVDDADWSCLQNKHDIIGNSKTTVIACKWTITK